MGYQKEREDFIATITKHGMPLDVARLLLREATGINRRAELACSSEAADRDRIPCPAMPKINNAGTVIGVAGPKGVPCLCDMYQGNHERIPRITLQDWYADRRIERAIAKLNAPIFAAGGTFDAGEARTWPIWRVITSGDPRGYTLRVVPPEYAEQNAQRSEHDPRSIGVPPGPSGLRW